MGGLPASAGTRAVVPPGIRRSGSESGLAASLRVRAPGLGCGVGVGSSAVVGLEDAAALSGIEGGCGSRGC
jgi:hypothetical protein